MSWFPMIGFRRALRAGLFTAPLILAGCLSYREQGELRADGSGSLKLAMGVPSGSDDPQKAADAEGTVKRLKGVAWIGKIDSSGEGLRWRGGSVEFDSLKALRPLNSALPLQDLFGNIKWTDSGSVGILSRTMKIPSASSDGHRQVFEVEWKVPGRILSTDRHATIVASDVARWTFSANGSDERTVRLEVRWSIPPLSRSIASAQEMRQRGPFVLGLAIADFLLALLAIRLALNAKSRARKAAQRSANS